MTSNEVLAIIGLLFTKSYNTYRSREELDFVQFNEQDAWEVDDVIDYLKKLKMPYRLVYDILDEKYNTFIHGKNLTESEFDYIEIDKNGRIGVWCEVDGFIAWLDEYNKKWCFKQDVSNVKGVLLENE